MGDVAACGLVALPTEVEGDGQDDFDHLSQVKAPLIFVTGSEDPWSKVQSLVQLVTDHELKADVVPIEGSDHFFADAHQRRIMAQTVADFLAGRLMGEA